MPVLALLCIFSNYDLQSFFPLPLIFFQSCKIHHCVEHIQSSDTFSGSLSSTYRPLSEKKCQTPAVTFSQLPGAGDVTSFIPTTGQGATGLAEHFGKDCSGNLKDTTFPIKFGWLHLTGFKTEVSIEH